MDFGKGKQVMQLHQYLNGKINPSGKLPFLFPKRLIDNGAHHMEKIYPGVEGSQF
ncbi:MAG: hypothetical protein CM15mP58_22870 [Burkholderiaceae bacterium]|nr:MAG: hypothetical protein CM15mP58_22870 [Burkholderiaceae bacterium]